MDALISYDTAIWLTLIEFVLTFIHLVSSHIFFLKYMERIEDHLSDIEMIGLHAGYYGDTWLGRRMRGSFITMILIMPGAFRKQEVIPLYKLQKLPGLLSVLDQMLLLFCDSSSFCNDRTLPAAKAGTPIASS
jgi:hypothetical protein